MSPGTGCLQGTGVRPRPARCRWRGSAVQTGIRGKRGSGEGAGSGRDGIRHRSGIRCRQVRRRPVPDVDRRWKSPSGLTETAGRALQVDVPTAREPGEHHGDGAGGTEVITVTKHAGPPHPRPRSRGHALAGSSMIPPGFHLEHPTASEGCRSASQGLTLTLNAGRDRTERTCRTSMPQSERAAPGPLQGRAQPRSCTNFTRWPSGSCSQANRSRPSGESVGLLRGLPPASRAL